MTTFYAPTVLQPFSYPSGSYDTSSPNTPIINTTNDKENSMNQYGSLDPPRTLSERLSRLTDNLQALGDRLKASVAGVVGDAVTDAVRDSVRKLLGGKASYRDQPAPDHYRDEDDDPWGDEDRRWEDEEVYAPTRETSPKSSRWRNALSAALQTCLWFLKRQPRRRPVLTTLCVTLAAGVTGFVAGPALMAGAGVLGSLAGLMFAA